MSGREIVFTHAKNCVGCNKCIDGCPAIYANVAYLEGNENKIRVDHGQMRSLR